MMRSTHTFPTNWEGQGESWKGGVGGLPVGETDDNIVVPFRAEHATAVARQ